MDMPASGERAEKELSAYIAKRHARRVKDEGERPHKAAWHKSADAYEAKRQQMARVEWHLHHTAQAKRLRRTLEALASHHEEQAAKLMGPGRMED